MDRDVYFYRYYTQWCKRLVHRGLDPGFRVVTGVLTCMCGLVEAPEWKRVSPFLAPFSSRCSFSMHRPVPSLACFHFHARPAIWGIGAESIQGSRDSIALPCSGSPPRSLRPQLFTHSAMPRCTYTYVAVPTATNALLFSSSSIDGVKY